MTALAQRYAAALVDVAVEHKNAEQMKKDLSAFAELHAQSADLRNFLASPAVPRADKQAVIGKLVARLEASALLRNFLCVIVDHHRSPMLPQIEQAFLAELHARLGVAEAEVISARELSAPEKAELTRLLERRTGKRVEARYRLDRELIGGAVVRLGSTIYDGSVREQLNRLRARLASD